MERTFLSAQAKKAAAAFGLKVENLPASPMETNHN
jgi:hypothetical protein